MKGCGVKDGLNQRGKVVFRDKKATGKRRYVKG